MNQPMEQYPYKRNVKWGIKPVYDHRTKQSETAVFICSYNDIFSCQYMQLCMHGFICACACYGLSRIVMYAPILKQRIMTCLRLAKSCLTSSKM